MLARLGGLLDLTLQKRARALSHPQHKTHHKHSRENTLSIARPSLSIARPSQSLPSPLTCRVKAELQPTHTPLWRSGFQGTWSTIGDAARAGGGSLPHSSTIHGG